MKVTVVLDDWLLQPLIEEHLATGRAVGTLIADSVSLRNRAMETISTKEGYALFLAKDDGRSTIYNAVRFLPKEEKE